ncbi:hypothetical protein Psi02_76120 [Planotetraspora silvatica]|uniref:HTH-like domain-containing protein n=1 Tax=Planotetraspora silvatica TaxID=234614 RepID=A0A8J3UTV7_9ACTN|nr:IS3 family transposase [Planotetraspora silvatica]GII51188.1 hypothetical protein Psi02_76120 [Planotetraspora silvatica]
MRAPTLREQRRADLDAAITAHFAASSGTYGLPRITRDLQHDGWRVSDNTVARMAALGLVARRRRQPQSLTRQGKRGALCVIAAKRCGTTLAEGGWVIGDNLIADIAGGRAAGLRTNWIDRDTWP